ncbi:Protein phosphatase 2a regulatory b subunit, partial [Globisporangium splendens]
MKGMLQTVKRKLSNTGEHLGVPSPDRMDVDGPKLATGVNGGISAGASSPVGEVARSDVSLPKRERRRSFLARNQKIQALKDLPHLKDTSLQRREALFQQKLELCSVIFNFDDPTSDKRGKDLKRQTLLELVDYVNNPGGQKIFTEALMPDIMAMVVAKKFVDQKFCLSIIELFDSEDPRERDYLKTILHRIYGKFMSHRSFIRKAISNVFYRFVYETERHNGVGELLEILGSIINGFAMPLKAEHLQFLVRALVPLHKPKCVSMYHQQLSYCITQYVEKDPETAVPIIQGILRFWPWSCSSKQVIFLNELEEILELMGSDQLQQVHKPLFQALAKWLGSQHFQVSERSLFLWNNEHLVNNGCLSKQHAHLILPVIYGPLHRNSLGHWNTTVEGLAQNVLKLYMDYDMALYDQCAKDYSMKEQSLNEKKEKEEEKWRKIEMSRRVVTRFFVSEREGPPSTTPNVTAPVNSSIPASGLEQKQRIGGLFLRSTDNMVRVLIRPVLSALSRSGAPKSIALRVSAHNALTFPSAGSDNAVVSVRMFSSKKDKKALLRITIRAVLIPSLDAKLGLEKKSLHDKFDEDPDVTEIPAEVQYLSEEELKALDEEEFDEDDIVVVDSDDEFDEDEDEDEDEEGMSVEEWAEKFEREVAEWDQEDGEGGAVEAGELEDDRLYIEMPGYDASLSLAEGSIENNDQEGSDPFANWDQGDAVTPEMLNWMLPADKRRPFSKGKDKPWKYFVNANHSDVVELALDVDLLRMFISPTGRIRPRRFTGLTAKQQRKLAQAVKISRQLALLPYLSRYPEPSPEQWKAMEEEDIAKMMAEIANSDGKEVVEDDDEDFDEDMEYD